MLLALRRDLIRDDLAASVVAGVRPVPKALIDRLHAYRSERREAEIAAHESFNYAVFDDETELLGCVYIDPPEKAGADAEVSWWVVDRLVGSDVERALDQLVPRWLAEDWPLDRPRYVPRDISWAEWQELPSVPTGDTAG